MKIRNVAHPSFRVSDLDKALRFYCDMLGFRKVFTITYKEFVEFTEQKLSPDDPTHAMLDDMRALGDAVWITYLEVAPHQYLELFSPEGEMPRNVFGLDKFDHIGYLHIALEVDDIHQAYEELKEKGANILTEPSFGVEQTWQCWMTDPDGNAIELMQYTDDSWQLGKKCK